jgi:ubiquinone/menaquinone biosynthesis C-methylase UbiE
MDRRTGHSLAATGERLVPEAQHGEVVHAEHLVRYHLAAQLAESRRVLDAACGEGYGTNLIAAANATSAVGVDLDARTVEHARLRYPAAEFVQGDVRRLPFEDGAFDLVVSFETIEHVPDPESALDECRRVLSSDGLLLISTPNKHQYLVDNEFHEREFFHEEFVDLLSSRFSTVEVLLQHNWLSSAVLSAPEALDSSGSETAVARFAKLMGIEPGGELYTVALCGDRRIPAVHPVIVGTTVDESHQLASRVVSAEKSAEKWHGEYLAARQTAEDWHREFEAAKTVAEKWHDEYQTLMGVYDSIWWRMTGPLRRLADRLRRRDG